MLVDEFESSEMVVVLDMVEMVVKLGCAEGISCER
jgi:hypothetical protein